MGSSLTSSAPLPGTGRRRATAIRMSPKRMPRRPSARGAASLVTSVASRVARRRLKEVNAHQLRGLSRGRPAPAAQAKAPRTKSPPRKALRASPSPPRPRSHRRARGLLRPLQAPAPLVHGSLSRALGTTLTAMGHRAMAAAARLLPRVLLVASSAARSPPSMPWLPPPPLLRALGLPPLSPRDSREDRRKSS